MVTLELIILENFTQTFLKIRMRTRKLALYVLINYSHVYFERVFSNFCHHLTAVNYLFVIEN